ncbi:AraC family transcriptional regulator [Ruegeria halocynthiae]|uniref:AraC family transcriptional regulator n=1 Tax=Ruegeria halocynthiae TaxID=985054 RepID=UPI000B20AE91|nr:AraC family transcriptional regulator [Ruegeria halocynthiae]
MPNHWIRSICALPRLSGHVTDALAAAGLTPAALQDIGAPVPRGSEAAILQFLSARLNDPFVGAGIGLEVNSRNSAMLTYILFNSHTLRDALYHVQRFAPVTRPRATIGIRTAADHVDFILDGIGPNLLLDTHLVEFSLGALLGAFRTATGTAHLATQIGLATPRRHGQRNLATLFGCPVVLGAQENYLRFPAASLDTPIRDADLQLLGHLTSYGEILLSRARPAPVTLSEAIERHLLHGMAAGRPKLSDAAVELGLSERTLNRRLQEEGTSFRALATRAQLKLANAFLSDPHLSLAETAHLCGFSDQSSFTQAYRRWTGRTPNADRKSLIKGEKLR